MVEPFHETSRIAVTIINAGATTAPLRAMLAMIFKE
jgi:hypothetical protein